MIKNMGKNEILKSRKEDRKDSHILHLHRKIKNANDNQNNCQSEENKGNLNVRNIFPDYGKKLTCFKIPKKAKCRIKSKNDLILHLKKSSKHNLIPHIHRFPIVLINRNKNIEIEIKKLSRRTEKQDKIISKMLVSTKKSDSRSICIQKEGIIKYRSPMIKKICGASDISTKLNLKKTIDLDLVVNFELKKITENCDDRNAKLNNCESASTSREEHIHNISVPGDFLVSNNNFAKCLYKNNERRNDAYINNLLRVKKRIIKLKKKYSNSVKKLESNVFSKFFENITSEDVIFSGRNIISENEILNILNNSESYKTFPKYNENTAQSNNVFKLPNSVIKRPPTRPNPFYQTGNITITKTNYNHTSIYSKKYKRQASTPNFEKQFPKNVQRPLFNFSSNENMEKESESDVISLFADSVSHIEDLLQDQEESIDNTDFVADHVPDEIFEQRDLLSNFNIQNIQQEEQMYDRSENIENVDDGTPLIDSNITAEENINQLSSPNQIIIYDNLQVLNTTDGVKKNIITKSTLNTNLIENHTIDNIVKYSVDQTRVPENKTNNLINNETNQYSNIKNIDKANKSANQLFSNCQLKVNDKIHHENNPDKNLPQRDLSCKANENSTDNLMLRTIENKFTFNKPQIPSSLLEYDPTENYNHIIPSYSPCFISSSSGSFNNTTCNINTEKQNQCLNTIETQHNDVTPPKQNDIQNQNSSIVKNKQETTKVQCHEFVLMLKYVCSNYLKFGSCRSKNVCKFVHEMPMDMEGCIRRMDRQQLLFVYNFYIKNKKYLFKSTFPWIVKCFGNLCDRDSLFLIAKEIKEITLDGDKLIYINCILDALADTFLEVKSGIEQLFDFFGTDDLNMVDILFELILKEGYFENNWSLIKRFANVSSYEIDLKHIESILGDCCTKEKPRKYHIYNVYYDVISKMADINLNKLSVKLIKTFMILLKQVGLYKEHNELLNRLESKDQPISSNQQNNTIVPIACSTWTHSSSNSDMLDSSSSLQTLSAIENVPFVSNEGYSLNVKKAYQLIHIHDTSAASKLLLNYDNSTEQEIFIDQLVTKFVIESEKYMEIMTCLADILEQNKCKTATMILNRYGLFVVLNYMYKENYFDAFNALNLINSNSISLFKTKLYGDFNYSQAKCCLLCCELLVINKNYSNAFDLMYSNETLFLLHRNKWLLQSEETDVNYREKVFANLIKMTINNDIHLAINIFETLMSIRQINVDFFIHCDDLIIKAFDNKYYFEIKNFVTKIPQYIFYELLPTTRRAVIISLVRINTRVLYIKFFSMCNSIYRKYNFSNRFLTISSYLHWEEIYCILNSCLYYISIEKPMQLTDITICVTDNSSSVDNTRHSASLLVGIDLSIDCIMERIKFVLEKRIVPPIVGLYTSNEVLIPIHQIRAYMYQRRQKFYRKR